ncbi:hypothetical protein SEVIR_7G333350v4 [Setaria viridis]
MSRPSPAAPACCLIIFAAIILFFVIILLIIFVILLIISLVVVFVFVVHVLRGQRVAAERGDMVNPEPAEDAVLCHEILQAHGALRRHPDPRVPGPGLLQAQDGVAGGGDSSTLDAAVGFRRIRMGGQVGEHQAGEPLLLHVV